MTDSKNPQVSVRAGDIKGNAVRNSSVMLNLLS